MIIATGFYSGYLPKAPGTWGSIVGLALFFLVQFLGIKLYITVVACLLLIGIYAAGEAEKIMDRKDPGLVVIDEIVGMMITMIAAPATPLIMVLGFILFRFFDILKPFPIRLVDRSFNGGLGIMLDDILAGIYSLLILQIIIRYIL
jgi:phosphatidylglycerophosphatase A